MDILEHAHAAYKAALQATRGNRFLTGKVLRRAAKLASPPADPALVESRVVTAMIARGEEATVRTIAEETGYSMRKTRETMERVASPVADSKDVFRL